jgi:hypothetical protein
MMNQQSGLRCSIQPSLHVGIFRPSSSGPFLDSPYTGAIKFDVPSLHWFAQPIEL